MTTQDQVKYIGLDKLNVLDKLKTLILDFQVTGSISLLMYGITDRKINDIDIVVPNFDFLSEIEKNYSVDYTVDYTLNQIKEEIEVGDHTKSVFPFDFVSTRTKNVMMPNKAGFKIDGVKIDAFVGKDLVCKELTSLGGAKFKVTHPYYSIEAKERFIHNYINLAEKQPLKSHQKETIMKHMKDMCNYHYCLGGGQFEPIKIMSKNYN